MDKFFVLLQRLVPQHLLSRLVGALAASEVRWWKNAFISLFIKIYGIDMSDYARSAAKDFVSFNDFFTRELRPDARSISGTISCPADGTISALGRINNNQIFQAKGRNYSLEKLMASEQVGDYVNGSFITIYLAPNNYHRVHFPTDCDLHSTRYVPGKLFSVNNVTAKHVENLFADNERLICEGLNQDGVTTIIMVGAMIVAGIQSSWREIGYRSRESQSESFVPVKSFLKGDELGQFYLGSTVILLFPGQINWNVNAGESVKFGQALASH